MTEGDVQAINQLKDAVASGENWYFALLQAIRLWTSAEEDFNGRHYVYLIDGEAFDWLLLAERLCDEISDSIPEKEKVDLLFYDRPPTELLKDDFKKLIGAAKYRAYLNFLYGVLVEEALVSAMVSEVRKEQRSIGLTKTGDDIDEAYRRIYGDKQQQLLDQFRQERKYRRLKSTSLSEMKAFTYWLFKYRMKRCDKSRVASDTRKALQYMHQNASARKLYTTV